MYRNIVRAAAAVGLMAGAAQAEEVNNGGWSFEAGAIYLHRQSVNEGALFLGDSPASGGIPLVNASDVNNVGSIGGVFVAKGDVAGRNVEFRGIFTKATGGNFFGNFAPQAGSNGISFAGTDPFGNGLFGPVTTLDLSVKRQSVLHSVEGNIDFYQAGSARFFAGVRGLALNDDLDLGMDATPSGFPGITNSVSVDARNRLLGLQIGAEFVLEPLSNENFALIATAKGGIFHNSSNVDISTSSVGIGLPAGAASSKANGTSGLIELGLQGTYNFRENVDFSLGYNLIAATNVASPVNTLNNSQTSVNNGVTSVIGTNTAIYHGITAKFSVRF